MENTTHLFLATRFNCNKCHDHPFERWTQDQYYQLAAFFARSRSRARSRQRRRNIGGTAVEGAKPLFEIVADRRDGEVKHDRTGRVTPPEFPFPVKFEAEAEATPPRAARRLDHLAGQPVLRQELRQPPLGLPARRRASSSRSTTSAPATRRRNPELLDYLTQEFIKSGFDVRHVLRLICKSRTYQLAFRRTSGTRTTRSTTRTPWPAACRPKCCSTRSTPRPARRRKFPGVPAGTRAAALPDSAIETADGFLGNLGRPARESACECERSSDLQLGPVMALVTGPTVGDAIGDPNNAISRLARDARDEREWIGELFLRFLGRPATAAEVEAVLHSMQAMDGQHQELVAAFQKYETESKPAREETARARETEIAAIGAEKSAYEVELAPRLAEAEAQRQARIAAAEAALAEADKGLPEKLVAWERDQKGRTGWTIVAAPEMASSFNKTEFKKQPDGSVLVTGPDQKQTYAVVAETALTSLSGLRLEALTDDRIPGKGPGRSGAGNFVLSELEAYWTPVIGPDWKLVSHWDFDSGAGDWKPEESCTLALENGGLRVTIKPNTRKSGISVPVKAPAGDYVAEVRLKTERKLNQRIFWTTQKDFSTADIRSSAVHTARGADGFTIHQFLISADSELVSVRLQTDNANVSYALDGVRLFAGKPVEPQKIKFTDAFATFSQQGYDVKSAVDGQAGGEPNGWAIYQDGVGKSQTAVFVCAQNNQPLAIGPSGSILKFVLNQQYPDGKHSLGRFRLSLTDEPAPLNYGLPREIVDILAAAPEGRNDDQKKAILAYFRAQDGAVKAGETALAQARQPLPPDPKLEEIKARLARAQQPLPPDARLETLRHDVELSTNQLANKRLIAAQDLAWALINNPAFLFNR